MRRPVGEVWDDALHHALARVQGIVCQKQATVLFLRTGVPQGARLQRHVGEPRRARTRASHPLWQPC